MSPLVFPIRPEFVRAFASGAKRYELRTRRPSVSAVDLVLIYETAPTSHGRIRTVPRGTVKDRRALTTAEKHIARGDAHHPATFAPTLADAFVLCYSQPGDLVGDPFVGSGTVAESCHRHGRLFVGGDLGHRERDGRRWADIVNDKLRQRQLFAEVHT